MSLCKHCKQSLDFWKVYKSFIRGYEPIKCADCGTVLNHSVKNRIVGSLSILLALLLVFWLNRSYGAEMSMLVQTGLFLILAFGLSMMSVFSMDFRVSEGRSASGA